MTRIKGLYYTNTKKPGKPIRHYIYAWRGGPLILKKEGGTRPNIGPKEVELYHQAITARTAAAEHTMARLVQDFRKSKEWKRFSDQTKRMWGIWLDRIDAKWGKTPISVWSDPRMVTKVVGWRDSYSETPRAADYGVGVLRRMLEFGRLNGRVKVNVAAGIPQLYEGGNRADIIWTPEDIAAFEAVASQQVIDGMRLACLTGLRRTDLVSLIWSEIGDLAIVKKAAKKSRGKQRTAVIPLYDRLRALLDELRTRERKEGVETVLVNGFGQAWSDDGFGQRFIAARDRANIVHDDGRKKHLHDCRGTFATELILAKFTDSEVADVLAWAPERVANIRKVYVDRERVVVALAERLNKVAVNHTVNQVEVRNEK